MLHDALLQSLSILIGTLNNFQNCKLTLVGNTLQMYSTQYHVAYVVGNTLQMYSTQYHVAGNGNTLQVYSTVPCGSSTKESALDLE